MHYSALFSELKLPEVKTTGNFPVITIPKDDLANIATRLVNECDLSLTLMYATDERKMSKVFVIHVIFSVADKPTLLTLRSEIPTNDLQYPSLTQTIMAAHWYERLIGDQFGIVATNHPDWRRLMHHENIPANTYPLRKDFDVNTQLNKAHEPYPMHSVEGKGVYEIPVGPIHAGIIEPGHFRFNVRGERILTLEGKLFFKHKGVEKLLEGKTITEATPFIEQVTGNMPIAHAIAFCEAVERITDTKVPIRAQYVRTFLNELERIAMHIFDIGNMAGNGTGFTFMAAQGFRLHELVRRLNDQLTGHRFLRGIIIPGGLSHDISDQVLQSAVNQLSNIESDLNEVLAVAYGSDGLMERFETTGILSKEAAIAYGAKGLPARASGINNDIRRDRPYAAYDKLLIEIQTKVDGDVRARFDMRALELTESFRLIKKCVADMPSGSHAVSCKEKAGSAYGWSEGWLGEVLDWVRLNADGTIERCVIRDPSFCNWPLFGEIGPGNIVPDFPLCNKSLNLSYSGTDL